MDECTYILTLSVGEKISLATDDRLSRYIDFDWVGVEKIMRLVRFMIECGAKPTHGSDNGPFGLAGICELTRLRRMSRLSHVWSILVPR